MSNSKYVTFGVDRTRKILGGTMTQFRELSGLSAPVRNYLHEGSKIYVREPFCLSYNKSGTDFHYIYRADYGPITDYKRKWRSSIFMPKEAARIFLKITSAKTQRIMDATIEDMRAEGFEDDPYTKSPFLPFVKEWSRMMQENYKDIFPDVMYSSNPYTVVYTFEVERR